MYNKLRVYLYILVWFRRFFFIWPILIMIYWALLWSWFRSSWGENEGRLLAYRLLSSPWLFIRNYTIMIRENCSTVGNSHTTKSSTATLSVLMSDVSIKDWFADNTGYNKKKDGRKKKRGGGGKRGTRRKNLKKKKVNERERGNPRPIFINRIYEG